MGKEKEGKSPWLSPRTGGEEQQGLGILCVNPLLGFMWLIPACFSHRSSPGRVQRENIAYGQGEGTGVRRAYGDAQGDPRALAGGEPGRM